MEKDNTDRSDLAMPVPAGTEERLDDPSLMAGSSLARHRAALEDLLQALPDRPDLERLYQRNVPLELILRLLGHQVDSNQIHYLLQCEDPRREITRLLGTV